MSKVLLGLIGAGIQRSASPAMQEEEGRHHGLRVHYQLIDLDAAGVGIEALPTLISAVRVMGFAGLNITYPCKQAVIPLLDDLSEEAGAMGAVNVVVHKDGRLVGHNTDGPGWSWGFRRALPGAKLGRVAMLGAGGAGSAVAYSAIRFGVEKLLIVDQDVERAAALARRLNEAIGAQRAVAAEDIGTALQGADGFIQATPVGMQKHPGMPIPGHLLRPELWVSEIIYFPLETQLLKAASRAGCQTMDGGHMNVGQACLNFELFTGRKPDMARMDAHFRRIVA
jgi:shikimate dehydrogenase